MIHQSLFYFLYTPRTQHSAACPTSASSLYTFGTRFLLLTSRITPNCPQYSIHIHATVIRKRTLKVTRLNVCLCAFVCTCALCNALFLGRWTRNSPCWDEARCHRNCSLDGLCHFSKESFLFSPRAAEHANTHTHTLSNLYN